MLRAKTASSNVTNAEVGSIHLSSITSYDVHGLGRSASCLGALSACVRRNHLCPGRCERVQLGDYCQQDETIGTAICAPPLATASSRRNAATPLWARVEVRPPAAT